MSMMEKKQVLQKVHKFIKKVRDNNGEIGNIPRAITLNYNNVCNFKCEFCFSAEENNEHIKDSLDFDIIGDIADQADALGIWEIVLTGGELLVNPEKLYSLVKIFKPERFQMVLITNGFLMTQEIADKLKDVGMDCVGVSISGLDAEEHNTSRGGVPTAHECALKALEYTKKARMSAWANVIFGHHNAESVDLKNLLNFVDEKGYSTYFMMAMPFGAWKDNILDANDMQVLAQLRKKHNCYFDTWDIYDKAKEKCSGCWTVNRIYITPLGDVLPCPYINIKIGNIKEQSLKEILEYGFSIKYFGEYSPICVSAQNRKFREKFLPEELTIFNPVDAKKIFDKDDYIK